MDSETVAGLYDQYGPALYRFLCGFTGNTSDASDILQNVFAQLADKNRSEVSNPGPYLWRAARNQACNYTYRRKNPLLVLRNGREASPGSRETIEKALGVLPPEQREVVILHVFEDMSFEEVGIQLGIPRDTAASRFRYAREKLKEIL